MKKNAQVGTAVIWGIGALMIIIGVILFMQSLNEKRDGLPELAIVEALVAVVLLIFGALSFYMAHK
jgi:uncharacterized membrane protein HdeD (DUF308 family)